MISLRTPFAVAALTLIAALPAAAQTAAVQAGPAVRITAPIDNTARVALAGSRPPLAGVAHDLGEVAPSMALHGVSLVFSRSAAQEAALQTLIAAQQNPASPLYRQWLTPDQFAAQFGVADADLATAEAWLQQQGFSIDSVARSRNRIFFSGTAAQVASAFGAPLHNFTAPDGSTRFAPASDLTLPAALGSAVMGVSNLSSFQIQPHLKLAPASGNAADPRFTSSVSGSHFLQPGDLAVEYDVKPAYSAGYNGANQSIAIIGQSYIYLSDVANFTSAAGITAKTPVLVLVPNSGSAAIDNNAKGDEGESDLDVEYSSAMAPGAQVYFVYTGNNTNYNVFNALQYAVDERISPIISSSYGACEVALGSSSIQQIDAILAQGVAQGQTILSAAGDDGSTDCFGSYASGSASNYALAADYPASSPYVTAMGGTEIPPAYTTVCNNTYFAAPTGSSCSGSTFVAGNSTDILTSLTTYAPEQVWNDDAVLAASPYNVTSPSSGGGGVSIYEPRPSWQTGTIGGVAIASSAYRTLPDIALLASDYSAPLLFCTSDTNDWETGQVNSCNKGFRDASTNDVNAAGGTSFDGPIFAGLLALIEQKVNAATSTAAGLGNINPTLYTLAANSTTYSKAFHDITSGGNQCLSGVSICGTGAQTTSYPAGTGYDEASGLGSIDLYNLLTAWPTTAASALAETTTTLTPATPTPSISTSDSIVITVAQYNPIAGLSTTPAGSVNLLLDGSSLGSLPLTAGTVTYAFSSTTSGAHVLVVNYGGDATHAASTGSVVITVGGTTTSGSFTISSTAVTIPTLGATGTSTLTVTPVGGYTGIVELGYTTYSSNLTNFCLADSNGGVVTITGTTGGTDTISAITNANTCTSNGFTILNRNGPGSGKVKLSALHAVRAANTPTPARPWQKAPLAAAALLLVLGLGGRRTRLLRGRIAGATLSLAMIAMLSLSLSGCSNNAAPSSTVANSNYTPAGTYTITLIGQDSNSATLTATTTLTVVVQ